MFRLSTATFRNNTERIFNLNPKALSSVILTKYYLDIKSSRLRWASHVALWVKGKVHKGICRGNVREREHTRDLSIEGRTILKCIFNKWNGGKRTASIWLRMGRCVGLL
jgi:hypothetical protein